MADFNVNQEIEGRKGLEIGMVVRQMKTVDTPAKILSFTRGMYLRGEVVAVLDNKKQFFCAILEKV